LLRERRFFPFFATQFLGNFNDNLYKNALVVLVTFSAASWTTMKPEVLTNLAAGVFMLPFFFFSATAGQLADKFDNARLAQWGKALEIVIIMLAALGFWLHSLPWLLTTLFLLGLQGSLFGTLKYSILPRHLQNHELVGGNALVEAGISVAILLGTLGGGLLAGLHSGIVWIVSICFALALSGFWASCRIPVTPAPMPELKISFNLLTETWRCIGFARRKHSVFLFILGVSWFWLYGTVLLAQFPVYTKTLLGGNESVVTLLLAVSCIGIGVGSLLCEKLSRRRGKPVEPGLVPIGALGMMIFGLDLAFAAPAQPSGMALSIVGVLQHSSTWRVLFDLAMVTGFGSLYCVPLYALIQQRSEAAYRARVIAGSNIINALFMIAGALTTAALLGLGYITIPTLFLCMALLHAGVMIYIFKVVPEFLVRSLIWLGLRTE
jgi:MFS family permease